MTDMNSPDSTWPDDLPVLTEVALDQPPDDLPILTEVIGLAEEPAPRSSITEQDFQQIVRQLEAHLDTIVADKLRLRLEQLQAQAVAQTLSELKAGLPLLVQEALNAHLKSG